MIPFGSLKNELNIDDNIENKTKILDKKKMLSIFDVEKELLEPYGLDDGLLEDMLRMVHDFHEESESQKFEDAYPEEIAAFRKILQDFAFDGKDTFNISISELSEKVPHCRTHGFERWCNENDVDMIDETTYGSRIIRFIFKN